MGEARGCFAFVPWGRLADASLFSMRGSQWMLCFYCTEGGEFKASLLAGERFGERFSTSRYESRISRVSALPKG